MLGLVLAGLLIVLSSKAEGKPIPLRYGKPLLPCLTLPPTPSQVWEIQELERGQHHRFVAMLQKWEQQEDYERRQKAAVQVDERRILMSEVPQGVPVVGGYRGTRGGEGRLQVL